MLAPNKVRAADAQTAKPVETQRLAPVWRLRDGRLECVFVPVPAPVNANNV